MTEVYGTTEIPSDQITVKSGGTISVSAAFATTVGLVGGMDTAEGIAEEGEAIRVDSTSDAETQFGEDSELAEAVQRSLLNGAGTVYAAPLAEEERTEEFTDTAEGTLEDIPFDPEIHDTHEITSDTKDIEIVYDSPPEQPSEDETIALNPVTREFTVGLADSFSITYTTGDHSEAIRSVIEFVPRFVGVCTENTEVANTLLTELEEYAKDFEFMHGVVGAHPEADAMDYEHSFDSRRLIVVAPSRAYTDEANENMVRTVPAVAGEQASRDLGDSTTADGVSGFADLHTKYRNSEAGALIDSGVMPLKQRGGITIAKDMTTSEDARFERVYASEVTDEATEISHQICQQYVGEANTEANRFALGESHDSSYAEMEDDNLLDAYAIAVSEGADPNEVDLDLSIDVVNVMDTISVEITVGDIIENGGVA